MNCESAGIQLQTPYTVALHNIRNTDLYNLDNALYMAPFAKQPSFVVHYMGIQLQGLEESTPQISTIC